jgi:ABC-type oligopeptide transport system ATPase subunit
LQEQLGLAYLFIGHDLGVVEHISNRVLVMNLGKIVESGTREEIYKDPKDPYTRSLLAAVPTLVDPRSAEGFGEVGEVDHGA